MAKTIWSALITAGILLALLGGMDFWGYFLVMPGKAPCLLTTGTLFVFMGLMGLLFLM